MASFTCLLQHAPHQGHHSYSALQFCEAALRQGHEIRQVFFYGDAVQHGNALLQIPSDELNMQMRWQAFAKEHQVPLVICATVGARQGVTEEGQGANLAGHFHAGGLAEFTEATAQSDRLVQF